MRYNQPRVLAAGNGFAIAAVGSKLHGFGIEVPEITNATAVAAGCVAVAVLTDGLRCWTRRPTKNGVLEAIAAKVNDAALEFYSIVSVSVSDRAVGFTGYNSYGEAHYVVIGTVGLPQDATVQEIVTARSDNPLGGDWHVAVKSPTLFQIAKNQIVVSTDWVHTLGWKAVFFNYSPLAHMEPDWVEDNHPDAVSVYGKYRMEVAEGYAYFDYLDGVQVPGLPYQVRNMPLRQDWVDIEIGHQCGVGLTADGVVHFWGTKPL
jgi:hypothetical protein